MDTGHVNRYSKFGLIPNLAFFLLVMEHQYA